LVAWLRSSVVKFNATLPPRMPIQHAREWVHHSPAGDLTPKLTRKAAGRHRAFDAVSGAGYFVERSAKLFDKGARRRQIGKAPTIITSLVSPNGASKSGRYAARFVKGNNHTVQFDIQALRGDRYLDNNGVFAFVGGRLTTSIR
jgi:hypothetical protein